MVAPEHAENVTVAACVNALGCPIPPMIIFKGKKLKSEFTDNLPSGSLVKMAPKGSMTTQLFIDFIHHLGKYMPDLSIKNQKHAVLHEPHHLMLLMSSPSLIIFRKFIDDLYSLVSAPKFTIWTRRLPLRCNDQAK